MKRNLIVLICILMFCAQAIPSFAVDADAIFKTKCVTCHGKDRKGNPAMAKMFKVEPAALDLSGKAALSKSDAEVIKITSDGKGKMPAFKGKLTEAEIGALAAYLKGGSAPGGKAAQAGGEAAAAKQNAPAENPVFMSKCASCHGKDKKGNVGMAKMFKVEPAALDLTNTATQAKSGEELSRIISDGKGKMPAYKSSLDEAQIEELVKLIKPAVEKSEPKVEAAKSSAAEVQASTGPVQAAPAAQ